MDTEYLLMVLVLHLVLGSSTLDTLFLVDLVIHLIMVILMNSDLVMYQDILLISLHRHLNLQNDNFTIALNHFNGPNGSKNITMCQDINYNLLKTNTSLGMNSTNLVSIDRSNKKFGTASGYFIGGGSIAINNLVNIVKPWTIETYFYPRSFGGAQTDYWIIWCKLYWIKIT